MWIAHSDIWFFDRTTWAKYSLEEGKTTSVIVDYENRKWFCTENGVVCFNDTTWTTFTIDDGLPDNEVYAIAEDNDGVIWAGTSQGVSSFDGTSWSTYSWKNYTSNDLYDDLIGNNVYTIAVDFNNIKWFGTTWSGVASFDDEEWKIYTTKNSGLKHREVRKIVVDSNNDKWLVYKPGTNLRCVTRYDGFSWYDVQTEGPVGHNVHKIGIDSGNVKWFSNVGDGVSLFNGIDWSTVVPPDFPENWRFFDFAVDEENIIWFGTGAGILSYANNEWTIFSPEETGITTQWIHCVAVDKNNVKWFGTPEGVSSFDGSAWETYTEADGLVHNTIYVIAVDKDNVKWIGTESGLSSFDGSMWTNHDANGFLAGNVVRDIAVDNNNMKWVGTNSGVACFDGIQWTTYTTENSGLVNNNVVCCAVDQNNVKWFGCSFRGCLVSFDGTTWIHYTRQDGLVSEQIIDIAVDRNNVKWFATYYGIASYDDTNKDNPARVLSDHSQQSFKILGNYPNPFNQSTIIEYLLPYESFVSLTIYSLSGQKVRELVSQTLPPGFNTSFWDGCDENGVNVSSGIYIFQLRAGSVRSMKRIVLIK